LNASRSLESGPLLIWSCKKSGIPWVAFTGFETPSLDTVADPLMLLISPIISLANAERGKSNSSIRMMKHVPCRVLSWVVPDVHIRFTMVLYLPDGGSS